LFAFSSENWQRPKEEVSMLMSRFLQALDDEVADLHENGIRLTFVGNLQQLSPALRERMAAAVALTAGNGAMTLVIAIAYGGRWDIACAARRLARSRSVDPHRRRAAHQQFSALESRVHGAVLLRRAVARFRRARARRCD